MRYDISLKMSYKYALPASGAKHMIRVMPLSIEGRQRLVAGALSISPKPEERTEYKDYFEHATTSISLIKPHDELIILMQARVVIDTQPSSPDFSPTLTGLQQALGKLNGLSAQSPHHFYGASPLIPESSDISYYAKECIQPSMSVREIALTLCNRIFHDFTYDSNATDVDTSPDAAFKMKRGVCQDFAHIMICALRSLGIPASYVSGFLRTLPPSGEKRLEGADAMHAWVRIWCGDTMGYIELDPTNNLVVSCDHIVVGYGRDYSDIAPVVGVIKSYGEQLTTQAVDVTPV